MTGLPWLENASLFSSGSAALAELVRWGAREHGWRRVWLPSYYCPDVPSALMAAVVPQVELRAYPDATLWARADLAAIAAALGDVVVVANQLGVRARPDTAAIEARGATIVEDHSHDLGSGWALASTAHYAFASLRKTLPIPDGGAVWSPRGLPLPPEPSAGTEASPTEGVTARPIGRLTASLATRGLSPADDRLRFRALARTAAEPGGAAAHPGISPVSRALLPQMPALAWRERRRENLAILADAVSSVADARMLVGPSGGVRAHARLRDWRAAARRPDRADGAGDCPGRPVAPPGATRLGCRRGGCRTLEPDPLDPRRPAVRRDGHAPVGRPAAQGARGLTCGAAASHRADPTWPAARLARGPARPSTDHQHFGRHFGSGDSCPVHANMAGILTITK